MSLIHRVAAATDAGESGVGLVVDLLSVRIQGRHYDPQSDDWEKLSAVPAAEQCGWLKDKYGLSWQIAPTAMNEMMERGTPEQLARVTQAFLKMKKFDIAELQKAFDGDSRVEVAR